MMGQGRDERYSEHLIRTKPIEGKLGEAAAALAGIFDGTCDIPITESRRGDRRVRAYLMDEDADLGYIEDASFVGIAEVAGQRAVQYVAEQHYPHAYRAGKPTYLYEFSPRRGELMMQKRETADDHPVLELPIPADNGHVSYFLQMVRDIQDKFGWIDYDSRLNRKEYDFELPELQ